MKGADDGKVEQNEVKVMSEVHVGCPPGISGPHISHFTITIPPGPGVDNTTRRHFFKDEIPLQVDEDGDLILTRRNSLMCRVIIQHNITSSIPNVGLQVWKAELVLSDFVLHKIFTTADFDGIISLELGAGTGLVGMLLAHVARTVYLTDRGDEILDNCVKNVQLNSEVLNYKGAIHVRELDWMISWPPPGSIEKSSCRTRYSWTPSDIEDVQRASLLVAADVIYSDDLTEALFRTLERLMSLGSKKVLYLALEKRYNFSLDDLDVVANGYMNFRSYIREEEDLELNEPSPFFIGKRIDLSVIPQYVREYNRGDDVELWQIKYCGRRREQGDVRFDRNLLSKLNLV